jgi:tetratricopeptide (TPR) repeat protein
LLVVIEDCHWRPVGAGDFILDLVTRLQDSRVIVLLTERPSPRDLGRRLAVRARSGLVRLTLPRLPEATARALVRALAPDAASPEAAIAQAAGHPLFLIRLLEANWTEGALPSSVAELVQEQVERLSDAERDALRQAAVLGASFDPVDAVAIFPGTASLRATGDLLHETETGLAFGHDLIHRAIYDAIPEDRRQVWHAQAARHFKGGDPLRWADHALRAADDTDAGRASVAAANAMVAARRFAVAFPYIEAGLARDGDPEARAELHSCRASIRRTRGDMAGALEDYRAAHAFAIKPETHVAMLTRQALVLHRLSRGDEADRALDAAEEIADANGFAGPIRAEIHEQRGNRAFVRGDPAACMVHHTAALNAARAAADPRGIARGHGGLGDAAYASGRFAEAYRHFSEAIDTAERAGLGLVREEYLFMRGFALFFANPGPEAFLLADVAVDSAIQCGAVRAIAVAREVRAEMRWAAGDLDGMQEDIEAIDALIPVRRESRISADVDILRVQLALRRGDPEAAQRMLAPLLETAETNADIGATAFGLSALLARTTAERDAALDRGMTCSARYALSHSVVWFHAAALERAFLDQDQALARRHMDALTAFAGDAPGSLMNAYVRTAELTLWPSNEDARRVHADWLRAHCLPGLADLMAGAGPIPSAARPEP